MRTRLALVAMFGFFASYFTVSLVGQEVVVYRKNADGTASIETATFNGRQADTSAVLGGSENYYGVDPANDHALVNLLVQERIRNELELVPEQVLAIQKAMRELKSLRRRSVTDGVLDPKDFVLDELRKKKVRAALEHSAKVRKELFEEVLLPEQQSRLRQIAWRTEIAQIGIISSLTDGRLGSGIEVSEQQYDVLERKGKGILERADQRISQILAEAEQEILELLPPEKRDAAKARLGKYFQVKIPKSTENPLRDFLDLEV